MENFSVTNIPDINTTNNSELGLTLVSKEAGYKHRALKILKTIKVKPGYIPKELKQGDLFLYTASTSKYDLYSNASDMSFGVATPKAGGRAILYAYSGIGVKFIKNQGTIQYEETFMPVITNNYLKQEFIYNGRVGNALKFIYREYVNDIARPAFSQELQYDLSESNIIGFRGLRIEILTATNTNVEYKVLSHFSK